MRASVFTLFSIPLFSIFLIAQNIDHPYEINKNGTLIHFFNDDKGPAGSIGDIISLHIQTYVKDDSLFFSSYDAIAPIDYTLDEPKFPGDFMSGLQLMSKGDSACFWVSVDSLRSYNIPSIGERRSYLKYVVKVFELDKPADFKIKQASLINDQFNREVSILNEYFRKNNIQAEGTATGLHYIIHKKGSGPKGQLKKKVKIHYRGKLLNGPTFDSSYKRDEPLGFVLGLKMVVPGFEEALLLMNVGDKATIYIPSKLAYGLKGNGGSIPPNSILEFDIEFLDMH